jgi:hypothetical protein
VDQTPLPQAVGEDEPDRADQPWCSIGDDQQRGAQAALDQLAEEACQGS